MPGERLILRAQFGPDREGPRHNGNKGASVQPRQRPRMGHALLSRHAGFVGAALTAGAGIALLAGLATPAGAVPFGWRPAFEPPPEISQPSQVQRPARPRRTLRATTPPKEKPATATEQRAAELPAKVKEPLQIVISIDKQQ